MGLQKKTKPESSFDSSSFPLLFLNPPLLFLFLLPLLLRFFLVFHLFSFLPLLFTRTILLFIFRFVFFFLLNFFCFFLFLRSAISFSSFSPVFPYWLLPYAILTSVPPIIAFFQLAQKHLPNPISINLI